MLRSASTVLSAVLLGMVAACSSGASPTGTGGAAGPPATGGTTGAEDAAIGLPIGSGGILAVGQDAGGAGRQAPSDASGSIAGTTGAGGTGGPIPSGTGGAAGGRPRGSGGDGTGGRGTGGAGGRSTSGPRGGAASGTGGRSTGGVAAGGTATTGTGGSSTGGQSAGGSTGGPKILWTDSIQSKPSPWGLDGLGTEHPIGTTVSPDDANGANLSVVPDPLGGTGLALRHFATFDSGGSRSQGGMYSDVNTVFGKQAKSPEGVWIAQEWYFPEAISANGDAYCWINLWDFHSVDGGRGNRWHTSPGLMLARDGSMKVSFEWGGPAYSINEGSGLSAVAMPVGRWFDIEMHYVWSDGPTGTITLWIDGQLALELTGVQTRDPAHQIAETYLKFYGSTQGRGPWTPTPSLKYTRNVRVAGERIWRDATPTP